MLKKSLLARLHRLQARAKQQHIAPIRHSYLKKLPADYIGEKHVVLLNRTAHRDGGVTVEMEERPGPAVGQEEDALRAAFQEEWRTTTRVSGRCSRTESNGGTRADRHPAVCLTL